MKEEERWGFFILEFFSLSFNGIMGIVVCFLKNIEKNSGNMEEEENTDDMGNKNEEQLKEDFGLSLTK